MVITRDPGPLLVFVGLQLTKTRNHLWAHLNYARVFFLSAHGARNLENHSESDENDFLLCYALYPKPRHRSWIIMVRERVVRRSRSIKTYVKRKVTILGQIQGTA